MRIYNTLTRKVEEFKPLKEGEVGIYSCGPTVYWNQHIGHMYAYVHWDVLVRAFTFLGYKVTRVMNITDVGHLTSDEDTGEDKMEKGAKREGLTVWQIAEKYIDQFIESMNLLNITKPSVLSRATEHIPEQIKLIEKMEKNGFTYKTSTGLVFDTSKFKGYANFARLDLSKQEAGARVEVDPEKKNPWDFLLWVTNQPNHIMKWESPWGTGFPGWHIECTAMSVKYLGENFDIHTGGKEHIPVHHTNEIAQGYGAFGHQTASYWMHNEWLSFKGQKMSKSLGNIYTAQDLQEKGFEPLALRYLILTSHYRQGLNFSLETLTAAQTALNNLRELVFAAKSDKGRPSLSSEKQDKLAGFQQEFRASLEEDINAPKALSVLWRAMKSNIPSEDKYDLAVSFDEVLGLRLAEAVTKLENTPEDIVVLAKKREEYRAKKDFINADKMRDEILSKGYILEDTPHGPKIRTKL